MKKIIGWALRVLLFAYEIMGFFFVYALAVYDITDGAMVGRAGVHLMFAASVLSAIGLMAAVLKWGE